MATKYIFFVLFPKRTPYNFIEDFLPPPLFFLLLFTINLLFLLNYFLKKVNWMLKLFFFLILCLAVTWQAENSRSLTTDNSRHVDASLHELVSWTNTFSLLCCFFPHWNISSRKLIKYCEKRMQHYYFFNFTAIASQMKMNSFILFQKFNFLFLSRLSLFEHFFVFRPYNIVFSLFLFQDLYFHLLFIMQNYYILCYMI